MNQGENTNSVATLGGSSIEKHQPVDPQQINNSYYTPNSAAVSWGTQVQNDSSRENGGLSSSVNNHNQQVGTAWSNIQEGTNAASVDSISSSATTSAAPGYSGYGAYPNTDPYGYSNTGYTAYYNQYQQQPNQYQQPPDQYQQPPNQYQQPPNQYQQPPNQYQQPPDQQPPNQYQQPPNQYQQPPNQYQQPPAQYQQPTAQYQQPTTQYQPPSAQSFPHHVGAYQNTGAPYQPLSSFQNTGSASYSSTYLGPADYQTSGNYTSGTYGPQTSLWPGGQYATYNSQQYPSYTPDTNSAYSSSIAVGTSEYQQHYKQWEDYYNQTQTEVSCAPGTENTSVSSASSVGCAVPSGSTSYTVPSNQIPAAYTPSWRPVSSSSELSSVQPVTTSSSIAEGYWKKESAVNQNDLPLNTVYSHFQMPPDVTSMHGSFQNQQSPAFSQGSTALYPASYQVSHIHPSSFQTVVQPPEQIDSRKASKLQIPTNPRIASNLLLGQQKTDKDSYMTSPAPKPAYISVSMQTPDVKVTSRDGADSSLKPAAFPKSLVGYVERALARCKDDRQKAAAQEIMKKVITDATADGTLNTRNWDTVPLFQMPNVDAVNKDNVEFLQPAFSTPNNRRSPGRRPKSRWEPVSDENLVNKSANTSNGTAKYGGWNRQLSGGNSNNKTSFATKFSLSDQKRYNKNVGRPAKKQRLGDDLRAADDSEASSGSDKEHSLTKYYSAAIALTDSPEEKRRRENRSKRFDKGHGNRAKNSNSRSKEVGAGNSYARRVALVLSKTFDESGSRAVEDIDWDALIVKGTCQEIEKRYLRLTAAPDPATVRPEEVLEKALLMVQTSPKNYLYKCDQLKSIRQDLTVQHIRNELTAKVYETHARLAIEAGDLPEYNQCQSQLTTLYAEGIKGCHMEFAAYNLLCVIMHSNNNRDLVSAMSRLSADAKRDEAVKHALSVRTAVTSGNYVMFFRLYKTAPNLSTFLMDLYVEKMRYAAVKCICRSYRPTVPVSYLSQILGFGTAFPVSETSDEKEMDGVEECAEWLKAHGASVTSDSSETLLDTKVSVSTLYMPDPEDAVSHGDANLAVNDFLTRSLVQTN